MATIKYMCGFETDLTFIAGEAAFTSASAALDSTTKHQTASGYGGAKSLKLTGGTGAAGFTIPGGGGAADEIHIALNHDGANIRTISFNDSGAQNQASVDFGADGLIRLRRGSSLTGTLLAVSVNPFSFNVWNTFKIVVTLREAASSGRMQVFMNGSTTAIVDTGAGVDCRNTSTDDYARINFGNGSGTSYWDDFVVASTGSLPDEPLFIPVLHPTSDGTVTWTHSTGASNFGVIDESPGGSVDTSDFNSTTVAANEDSFGMSDLAASPSTIVGVKVSIYVTGDGTLTNARTRVKSGATVARGTNQGIGNGTYSTVADYYTTDPNTAAAWTASGINAMEAGYQANT